MTVYLIRDIPGCNSKAVALYVSKIKQRMKYIESIGLVTMSDKCNLHYENRKYFLLKASNDCCIMLQRNEIILSNLRYCLIFQHWFDNWGVEKLL